MIEMIFQRFGADRADDGCAIDEGGEVDRAIVAVVDGLVVRESDVHGRVLISGAIARRASVRGVESGGDVHDAAFDSASCCAIA